MNRPSIIECLSHGPVDARRARAALGWSWCWPRDRKLAFVAKAVGATPPGPPEIGSALLVSVTGDGRAGALFVLRADDPHGMALQREARDALLKCERLVTRDLPVLIGTGELLRPTSWGAQLIWKDDEREAIESIDGPSFGGAMAVAVASRLLCRPVPGAIAVLAAVTDGGGLGPVDGITEKLDLVSRMAPAVETVVVAELQRAEVAKAAASLDRKLMVEGAGNLKELFGHVFGNLARGPAPWLSGSGAASRAATDLFRISIEGSPVLAWHHVAAAASRVRKRLPARSRERALAEFARRVALRHDHRLAPIPWPREDELTELPRPLQQAYLAHSLQSAVDAGLVSLPALVTRVRARLPDKIQDHHPADLRLRGALGRALARIRRYDEAEEVLKSAFDAWLAIFEEAEATYPLCELLRMAGIRKDRRRVEALLVHLRAIEFSTGADFMDRAYLHLNAGKALVQTGKHRDALTWLEEDRFTLVRDDARISAARWRARAFDQLGRRRDADAARALVFEGGGEHAVIAEVDEALARRRSPGPAFRRLRLMSPARVRFLQEGLGLDAAATQVAEEGPW